MATLTRGERFKDARNVHNKNGKQTMGTVEQDTGVSASLISALENDNSERSVGYDKVAILAKHYGVSADWLLCLTEDPAPKPCAADELGLSTTVIDGIKHYKELGVWSLAGLNTFLEATLPTGLFDEIYMLKREIVSELDTKPSVIESEHAELYSKFGKVRGDAVVMHKLEDILIEQYPELEGRITVRISSFNLKEYYDGIIRLFKRCLDGITGYSNVVK